MPVVTLDTRIFTVPLLAAPRYACQCTLHRSATLAQRLLGNVVGHLVRATLGEPMQLMTEEPVPGPAVERGEQLISQASIAIAHTYLASVLEAARFAVCSLIGTFITCKPVAARGAEPSPLIASHGTLTHSRACAIRCLAAINSQNRE